MLTQECYAVCKKCNRSYSYFPPLAADHPVQDISYLPEENYIQENDPQQQSLDRENRHLFPEYRSLCEYVTKKERFEDTEYEYQPPYYHEVYCKSYSLLNNLRHAVNPSKQQCVHPGFHCVQRSKMMSFVRRRWDSECWEPYVKEIASGCDCMWPVSVLGDITDHY